MSRRRRDPGDIAADIRRWMREGERTQTEVAEMLRVQQPQVSRILKGQFGRRSAAVDKLCRLAGISQFVSASAIGADEKAFGRSESDLLSLLRGVWDGTEDDINRVAALLSAAAELRRASRQRHPK